MNRLYKKLVLLPAVMTIGCTSGDKNSSLPNNNSQLAQYKAMLEYTPKVKNRLSVTSNNQQSFNISGMVTLASISVKFFSNNNCNESALTASVTMNGGAQGTVFNSGTYTSTNLSNYVLCGRYSNGTTSNSGCSGMYTDFTNNQIQSVRFDYSYAAASGGPGIVAGNCMSGSSSSLYKEAIIDWSNGGSPWAECSNGTACGFSQAYNVNLPTTYTTQPAITVLPIANWQTVMGSAFAFNASITGGSSRVTPDITGLSGGIISPTYCDLDSSSNSSCVFIITPYANTGDYSFWNPSSTDNSMDVDNPSAVPFNELNLTINTSTSTTVNGSAAPLVINNISGAVIAPYIYLPAPTEGAATESNIGITWGSGGAIDPRFEYINDSCLDILRDNLTGLEWLANANMVGASTWNDAQIAVTDFNNAGGVCDYTDWRLPTINELRSLINYQLIQAGYTPAGWLNNNGFGSSVSQDAYWSSDKYDDNSAYVINFINGEAYVRQTSQFSWIWAVRGGQ